MLHENEHFLPSAEFSARAAVGSMAGYREIYARSVADPEGFWSEVAGRLDWMKPFSRVLDWDFEAARVRWFEDGCLNVSVNCLDRHVAAGRGRHRALIWEGDDPQDSLTLTYADLLARVERFGNVLRKRGVKWGDRVCIYLPMVPELAVAMLACARIGAVHNIVFAGFSAESLRQRIEDCGCSVVITADQGLRGGKAIPLKETTNAAIRGLDVVRQVFVLKRTGATVPADPRDRDWHEEIEAPDVGGPCAPEEMGAEDPLFILYTSGSTGKPKGVLHTTGGYLTYASYTHELVFDLKPDDVYFCTADIGWITGHSYVIYGPLANAATSIMFEGTPAYPDIGRYWDVVDKHGVTIFYTAPTAIRSVMKAGDDPVKARSRRSLRILGSVGEPINPEVWLWYHQVVGDGRCRIVDTYWQTETGGMMIAPLPGATPLKPGSATLPLPGIRPLLVDEKGQVIDGNDVDGMLCIGFPWPGMARTVYGDHERFRHNYFSHFKGLYFSGDGCHRDHEGYHWITGRVDDVINVSGHRLGTAEIESGLLEHHGLSEAAVVGMPHDVKGQGIYAFVVPQDATEPSEELRRELIDTVRRVIGPLATPDRIQFAPSLPRTRSGKIMRRILRKIVEGEEDRLGDVSTLADPGIVKTIIDGRLL
ncbi:MAG: acetate--CoA ligase [Planctomycetes bacterium]|nr:acetate--CoA ligase [Planctomycetota bacterium]